MTFSEILVFSPDFPVIFSGFSEYFSDFSVFFWILCILPTSIFPDFKSIFPNFQGIIRISLEVSVFHILPLTSLNAFIYIQAKMLKSG